VDRRTFRLFVATLAGIVVVVAVVASLAGGTARDPDAPDGEQAVGIVTSIDSEGLADVRGFTLRTGGGQELAFRIGVLENGAEFPPGHLSEHQSLATLVRVWYRTEGEVQVAFRLEDAEE
jgi:hypothetical protein